jgi:hypothetical protein
MAIDHTRTADYDYSDDGGRWAQWRRLAVHQREFAEQHPCRTIEDCASARYTYRCGLKYNLHLTYETFHPRPLYHISCSVIEEVGSENEFGQPKEAMLPVEVWTKEHFEAARELMAMSLGPAIASKDQQMQEARGPLALHWLTFDPRRMVMTRSILIPS